MLSRQTKRNFARIAPFGLIWLLFSVIYSLLERGLLGELNYYPATGNPYNFGGTVFITACMAVFCGLLIGSVEVLYLNRLFINRSFQQKVIFKTGIYLTFIILFLLMTTLLFNAYALQQNIFAPEVVRNTAIFFTNFAFWSVTFYIACIIGISLFFHEVSENIGHGVVTNFFSGRYHTPKQEERIFMFLDMKSSTTLAEQMGHGRYFTMLKAYFADLSAPIIDYSGEVYQYAGDEMIITWTLKKGLHNNACIHCFFALKQALQQHAEKYKLQFGVLPAFKAGLHAGTVTTGEIGVIKREIIFTGDVLNTTARIQSLCNAYNTDILLSGDLVRKLSADESFVVLSLGEVELRGRDKRLELFRVSDS
ncbi:MAG TPA: adenylate/guanylate cyclase domain-containing protein [Cyclobacteriaceae bacterium]|nr:adenylate/guanylate cyclase domain-containing protein [Cyclobacteriaceae bacterium]HMV09395.1 adenylate/guanylate cyclase domain-containing protein [Cyclobacteriaceae bacterium]HMV91483.1 adenylate/guanylate cyclase domain-containing protein [Cyclobacteriaceae bacterium]HMX51096.1 adenylate/guanylate cyclase domain-containing protein [Cyclobacteriaceae bacterium]HMY91758.1 adenylate/guanylate cyclase domain-containing protein [Cyclobacteriaceae bacterium]